jgi:hypothetical protein
MPWGLYYRAQEYGRAEAVRWFCLVLDPCNRGPKFSWADMPARVAQAASVHCHTHNREEDWARYSEAIRQAASEAAAAAMREFMADSRVESWWPSAAQLGAAAPSLAWHDSGGGRRAHICLNNLVVAVAHVYRADHAMQVALSERPRGYWDPVQPAVPRDAEAEPKWVGVLRLPPPNRDEWVCPERWDNLADAERGMSLALFRAVLALASTLQGGPVRLQQDRPSPTE